MSKVRINILDIKLIWLRKVVNILNFYTIKFYCFKKIWKCKNCEGSQRNVKECLGHREQYLGEYL